MLKLGVGGGDGTVPALIGLTLGENQFLNKPFRGMLQGGRQEVRRWAREAATMSSILLGKLGTAMMSLNCLLQTLRKSSIILHLIRTPLNESTLLAPLLLYFFMPEGKFKTGMGKTGCCIWQVQG